MQEDGIGMARTFERGFSEVRDEITAPRLGFFAWVDGAPADGYRAHRQAPASTVKSSGSSNTGRKPVFWRKHRSNWTYRGGVDIARVLADEPAEHRYLLPDVCLSQGQFPDGLSVADLPRQVDVAATHGRALRKALEEP